MAFAASATSVADQDRTSQWVRAATGRIFGDETRERDRQLEKEGPVEWLVGKGRPLLGSSKRRREKGGLC